MRRAIQLFMIIHNPLSMMVYNTKHKQIYSIKCISNHTISCNYNSPTSNICIKSTLEEQKPHTSMHVRTHPTACHRNYCFYMTWFTLIMMWYKTLGVHFSLNKFVSLGMTVQYNVSFFEHNYVSFAHMSIRSNPYICFFIVTMCNLTTSLFNFLNILNHYEISQNITWKCFILILISHIWPPNILIKCLKPVYASIGSILIEILAMEIIEYMFKAHKNPSHQLSRIT